MSRVSRRVRRGLAAGALVPALAFLTGAVWLYDASTRPRADWAGESIDVDLPPGISAQAMIDRLARAGVIRHPSVARLNLRLTGGAEALHAGEYRFDRPVSIRQVLARLRAGDVLLHAVTVPEGFVLEDIAAKVADAGLGETEPLVAAFRDPSPVADLDPQAEDLEGYLYPETYRFPRDVEPMTVARAMVERFRKTVGDDYAERARAVGLTLRQAVTLASMIERETSVPDERRRISAVFHNRLERGMKMQCDPTVLYALRRAGQPVEALRLRHLEFRSPWNTYAVAGLPPGPIANPGKASLEAAVDPLDSDELYFVAAPEGGHRFSRTLGQHQAAVAAWRSYLRSTR